MPRNDQSRREDNESVLGGESKIEQQLQPPEPMEAKAPDVPEKNTVTVTVAPRRSLTVPHQAGVRMEGDKEVPVFTTRIAGPGSKVEVHPSEIPHLTASGFIEPGHIPSGFDNVPPNVVPGTVRVNGNDGTVTEVERA